MQIQIICIKSLKYVLLHLFQNMQNHKIICNIIFHKEGIIKKSKMIVDRSETMNDYTTYNFVADELRILKKCMWLALCLLICVFACHLVV